jgi:preprotein translocase subunit YajC
VNQVLLAQSAPVAQPAAAPAPAPTAAVAAAPAAPQTAQGVAVPAFQQPAGAAPQGPGGIAGFFASPIFLLILMFVVFYFLLIRPQQKKQKEHQKLLGGLKKGDDVILSTGMFGKIAGLTDTVATIEIADKVRVKVLRSQIAGLAPTTQAAQQAVASSPTPAEQK